jgi:cyanate permease
LLIVVPVPNSLGSRAGRLVGSNQSISSSFHSNSKWKLSALAQTTGTYQLFISLLIVVSVPNSLGTRAGRLVGSNQSISSSFHSNSKWKLSALAQTTGTYQLFISLLIVVSVPNSLGTRAGRLVGSNQHISIEDDLY